MINPIVTQGFIFNNNGSFIISQGYGLIDGSYSAPVEPVITIDTGVIADYINQGVVVVRNGRVVVSYQKRQYGTINRGETNAVSGINTKLSPQFGVVFDRFYLDYPGQQEGVSQ